MILEMKITEVSQNFNTFIKKSTCMPGNLGKSKLVMKSH